MVLEDREYMRPNFGGPQGGLKVGRSPVLLLIIANVVIFILVPRSAFHYLELDAFRWGSPAILKTLTGIFTYQFLHANIEHLVWNMLVLYMVGRIIENDLSMFNYIRLYLGAGAVGGLTWCFFCKSDFPMVGASGAIAGIILAVAMIHPNKVINLFFVLPVRLKWFSLGIILFDILMFREQRVGNSPTNQVAYLAHIGGAAGGYLMLLIYHKYLIRLKWRDIIDFSNGKKSRSRRGKRPIPFPGGNPRSQSSDDPAVESDPFLKIDPILDKIGKHGMKSLTKKEKEMLDRARKKLK